MSKTIGLVQNNHLVLGFGWDKLPAHANALSSNPVDTPNSFVRLLSICCVIRLYEKGSVF